VEDTLESIPIEQPIPTDEEPQNLCLDAGYDYADVRDTIAAWAILLISGLGTKRLGSKLTFLAFVLGDGSLNGRIRG